MALEFDEQLSRLEKPNRNEMTNKEYLSTTCSRSCL